MGVAHYGIVPVGNYGASSRTEDQREYSTKESAFESATAAAFHGDPSGPRGAYQRAMRRGERDYFESLLTPLTR
jgi:hypothetical protein